MVDRPALVGKTFKEAFPELADHAIARSLERVQRTGETLRLEELSVPLVRAGRASEAFFDCVAQPMRDGDGVARVILVATEVTEQRVARMREESLRADAE